MDAVISYQRGDSEGQARGLGMPRRAALHDAAATPAGSADKYWLGASVAVIFGLLMWTLATQSPLQVMDAEGTFSGPNPAAMALAANARAGR